MREATGAAAVVPTRAEAGFPDLLPSQTPTVYSGVNAKHHASWFPLDVPVFQATS